MNLRILLLFIVALTLPAATITVCASGCDYTNPQTAINNAVRGDFIELKAGEVFEGVYSLPYKTGNGYITIRTSRWRELPPAGTRITTDHTSLMATMQPSSNSSPVLSAGYDETYPSGVSTGSDTITYGSAHGFVEGDPIACWNDDGSIPIVENQVYYVRNPTSTTFQLSTTPTGSIVDIQTSVTATRFRCTMTRPISHWRIQGIELRKKTGQDTLYNLVQIGSGQETAREGIVHHIELDHVYIHGVREENGPRVCLMLNAAYASIVDSRIEHCVKEGEESKGIGGFQAPGPILIRNNYIAAGSINILYGGDYVRIQGLVNGDNGGFRIEGNHLTRPLWVRYHAGTGGTSAPAGACSDYTRYLNVTTGQWYVCLSSAWTVAATCADDEYFRRTDVTQNCASGACWKCSGGVFVSSSVMRGSGYNVKNLFELKSIINATVTGNLIETNWGDAQSGIAVWVISQVDQYNANAWVRGEDIRFERNIIRNSSQGIRVGSEGSTTFGVNNTRIQVRDNLLYKIGTTDYPSFSFTDSRPISFSGYCDDCVFDHNTVSSNTTGGAGLTFDTKSMARFRMSNSITHENQYGLQYDGGVACTTYLPSPSIMTNIVMIRSDTGSGSESSCATNWKHISNATTMFVGSGNYRLQSTSPYSASCASGCDFTGTDGKDLGADVDLVEMATGGASSGVRWLGNTVKVFPGSTKTLVTYIAPNTSACAVYLYTNVARTTLHADTDAGGEQTDSRTGSITSGINRQLVLGTSSALTANTDYWLKLTCGTEIAIVPVRTAAAGSGTYNVVNKYSIARSGEYSSSADMSSPTAISSATTHTVPVASGAVVYYRQTGGAIKAFVAK